MSKLKLVDRMLLLLLAVVAAACLGFGIYTFVLGYWQITTIFLITLACVAALSYDVVATGNLELNRFYDKNLKEMMRCTEK